MTEEEMKIANTMEKYGGSFVHTLGEALWRADRRNIERIKAAFPDYWEEYKKMI